MNKFVICIVLIIFSFGSMGTKWQNYKVERVKIAEGVYVEKKINSSSGKLISEEYKIVIQGNFFDAQFKDGKWALSMMGQEAFDEFEKSGDTGGGGGGCN